MRTWRPAWRKSPCWNAMKSGASPTPGVSATLITLLVSLNVGVAVEVLLPVHAATVSRLAIRAVMLARPRTGRPALRWSAVRPPIGTSLTGTPCARKQDGYEQFGTCRSASRVPYYRWPVGQTPDTSAFFQVMWELLSVGRLGAMVSPESRCPRRARTMSPAEGVRHVGSAATSAGPRAGYGTLVRGPHAVRSRSKKNPGSGPVAEGEQARAGSAFSGGAADPGPGNGQNGRVGDPDPGGVPQPETSAGRPPS